MEIKPSEIDTIDSLGLLDGEDVKLLRTSGGLYIALGKLKGKPKEEVLAAGSHPAIVRYNIEKTYKNFQPVLMKSEREEEEIVSEMSLLLPKDMIDNGYDFYVIKKSSHIDLVLTKAQVEVLKYEGAITETDFVVTKANQLITPEVAPVAKAATIASAIIAIEEGKETVFHNNKRYDADSILKKT
jgi:hypothetical protein